MAHEDSEPQPAHRASTRRMVPMKRIVCLANSRKLHGRCIAGREWDGQKPGAWIRPVSEREGHEVSEYERQYEDGSDPAVLDIVDIPVLEAQPESYQTENWLLDPKYYWNRAGRLPRTLLRDLVDDVGPLWVDGHSTYNGVNDKIPLDETDEVADSLRLIRVGDLSLKVYAPGEAFGNNKRRVQGEFTYAGTQYGLWVTDPSHERKWLAGPDGHYSIGNCYLTVSLGEPYEGACYKLIAAIIDLES